MKLDERITQILELNPEHIGQVEIRINYLWAYKFFRKKFGVRKSKELAFFRSKLWNAERRKSSYSHFKDKVNLFVDGVNVKISKNKKQSKVMRNAEHKIIVWGKYD